MIQGIELRKLVDSSTLSQCEIAKRAGTSQSSLAHQMIRGCSESYYNKIKKVIEQEENTMDKMYEKVTITTEKGSVTVSGRMLDAMICIATDHVKESGEDYNVTMSDIVNVGRQVLGIIWDIKD